jgi:hypothetical protein
VSAMPVARTESAALTPSPVARAGSLFGATR